MEFQINDTTKCDLFVALFQHIKQFTDFTNILLQDERMYIQCMDTACVIVFEIILPASWFASYTLSNESVNLGVNTTILYKVLNTRDKTQTIEIRSEDDRLNVLFANPDTETNKNIFNKHFEIPLLDIRTELMEIPDIEHQAEFTMPCATFASLINQLKNFGDTMSVVCSEEAISLESFSIDLGKMSVNVSIDDLEEFAIEEGKKMELRFSLKYLHDICLYQKICKNIFIGISDNSPLKASYMLDDDVSLSFYLAPKIDE